MVRHSRKLLMCLNILSCSRRKLYGEQFTWRTVFKRKYSLDLLHSYTKFGQPVDNNSYALEVLLESINGLEHK